VTLTPESEARGFRFPNEAERAALLTSLGSMELPQE
jgi:hypothetical protein